MSGNNNKQLPSWIKPYTADAYNHAYTFLYCGQPKEIREMIDQVKSDNNFSNRFTNEFFKEVKRMAEYEMPLDDLKALERREKMENRHISQHKASAPPILSKDEQPKTKEIPPISGSSSETQNPS